jgi:hypothetical protein
MKSFSQFLNESYLEERDMKRRKSSKSVEDLKIEQERTAAEKAKRAAARQPSGAAARPDLQFKRSTVASPTTTPSSGSTATPPTGPVRSSIGNVSGPASNPTRPTGTPPTGPVRSSIGNVSGPASNPTRPTGTPPTGPVRSSIGNVSGPASNPKPPKPPKGVKPPTSPTPTSPTVGKPPIGVKPSGKWAKIGKFAGPAAAALDTALSTADERSKGSGWARSLAKGATVAAGGLAGGAIGALGGGGIGSAALGTAGAIGGAELAGRAFDVAAGANAKERKAMATANRQRQVGSAVKGIGGSTSFSQKKPGGPAFMSTGSGAQRKTVQLAKTGVVQRGGQSVAGYLAKKDGKAVYKAGPSAQSLAKTSSNPLERVGRSLFAGAYKAHDAKQAAKKLATARASDAARNLKLGVKAKPAG